MSMPPEKNLDVLCVGIAVADVLGKPIDEIPPWDRLGTVDQVEHHTGGCAANTAVDLVRLGLRAGICACLGNDAAGLFVRNTLRDTGVDTSGLVETDQAATSYTFVMIGSDGRRRFLHHVGANAQLMESDVSDAVLSRSRLLHIGGAFLMPALDGQPAARLLERAKKLGLKTSLDTAFNPNVDSEALIVPCLPYLDIFFPSIEEAAAITGKSDTEEIFDWFGDHPVPIMGIKLGKQGCVVREEGKPIHYPAYPIDVVDGSGAGDAFVAGFLYGILEDWSIADSARFGNATAAHCIRAIGCSTGIRPAADIREFMKVRRSYC